MVTLACPSIIKNKNLWQTLPFVNGKFTDITTPTKFEVKNPANGQIIASLPSMHGTHIDEVTKIASRSFQSWKSTTFAERSKVLKKMADLMEKYRDDLAAIVTLEAGKPYAEAKGELIYAQSFYEYYSEEIKRPYGDFIPAPVRGRRVFTIKQPIGPVGLITPWNFPAAMITRKVGPALAAGCTVVLKPSEETPLSALALCAIADEAGLPPGVLNVVPVGRDNVREAGLALCTSPDLRKISFTGSTTVGKVLMRDSSSSVKRLSLELGGNAPFIVCADADLDIALSALMNAKFRNAGQACIASNRILVHDKIYDQFADMLSKKISATLVCGDGFGPNTTLGPLINDQGLSKIANQVRSSVSEGATVLTGGDIHTELNQKGGTFYRPTVLTGVKATMPPFVEESFGPIAPLLSFTTDEEAISIANDTKAGLAGYVCTRDVSRMFRIAEALEVGMVGVNEGAISNAAVPFGGVKESGLGREGSALGLDEYLEVKSVTVGGV